MFVSNGVLVKTPTASSSYFTSMPPMSSALWSAHYSQIFRSQLWVAVVVMKRARALARLPIPVYRRKSDDGRERDPVVHEGAGERVPRDDDEHQHAEEAKSEAQSEA